MTGPDAYGLVEKTHEQQKKRLYRERYPIEMHRTAGCLLICIIIGMYRHHYEVTGKNWTAQSDFPDDNVPSHRCAKLTKAIVKALAWEPLAQAAYSSDLALSRLPPICIIGTRIG
ncbi:hypothetical protein TNCV_3445221 [Trichonephila clavipes]|nr:hypothetical protein TNCV_3445221 [Trichonephila clavipes]